MMTGDGQEDGGSGETANTGLATSGHERGQSSGGTSVADTGRGRASVVSNAMDALRQTLSAGFSAMSTFLGASSRSVAVGR